MSTPTQTREIISQSKLILSFIKIFKKGGRAASFRKFDYGKKPEPRHAQIHPVPTKKAPRYHTKKFPSLALSSALPHPATALPEFASARPGAGLVKPHPRGKTSRHRVRELRANEKDHIMATKTAQ